MCEQVVGEGVARAKTEGGKTMGVKATVAGTQCTMGEESKVRGLAGAEQRLTGGRCQICMNKGNRREIRVDGEASERRRE